MNNRELTWAQVVCVGVLLAAATGEAAVSLPHVFSDNMVLQRDKPVPVWGWAGKGEAVRVKCGDQEKSATADGNGNWMVRLDPMKGDKTGRELTVSGENKITFKNVLVGEVWLCAGQSNMQMRLSEVAGGAAEVAATAEYPTIRYIIIPHACYAERQQNKSFGGWQVVSPSTAWNCTAVGYFFAREVAKNIDVPIGIMENTWGGAAQIEKWICREGLAAVPELEELSRQVEQSHAGKAGAKQNPPPGPSAPAFSGGELMTIYSSKDSPLVPYAIRGATWYQGEGNGGEGESYYHKMQALVVGWRRIWNQGDFPFYFVQLPNYQASDPNKPEMGYGWAKTREAQFKSLSIPNTGMAVTIDTGEGGNIHPTKNKQDIGNRLAAWALANDYGKKIEYSGPLYRRFTVQGNHIRIHFDHAGSGLIVGEKKGLDLVREIADGKLKWISIAGADKKFHWAEAVIDGNALVVSSDKVPNPVAVRYAFTANPEGPGLYNKDGFPASPFRTDNW